MSKVSRKDSHPTFKNYDGPTIEELELILNRIEELDSKLENYIMKQVNSKQAA